MNTQTNVRGCERFKLRCGKCFCEIEIACDGPHVCPRCGTPLIVQWREGRDQIERDLAAAVPSATWDGWDAGMIHRA